MWQDLLVCIDNSRLRLPNCPLPPPLNPLFLDVFLALLICHEIVRYRAEPVIAAFLLELVAFATVVGDPLILVDRLLLASARDA